MSDRPLVTIVTPFLNPGAFLREAVESVRAQTYAHWELLLIDDGSTDGSSAEARAWAVAMPKRIRYLEHPGHRNLGMSASRNLGLRHARGEFVAGLDADDVWLPEKLERQVPLMLAHPDAGLLYGNTLYWHSWDAASASPQADYMPPLGVPETLLAPPELLGYGLRGEVAMPCICSAVMRRSVLEAIGGWEDQFRGAFEDQVVFAKLMLAAPVYVSHACLDKYRQHARSSTSELERSGRYRQARGHYLRWLGAYLASAPRVTPAVRRAYRGALLAHRHPGLAALLLRARRAVSSIAARPTR